MLFMSEVRPPTEFQFYLIDSAARKLLDHLGVTQVTHAADDPTAQEVDKTMVPLPVTSSFAGKAEEGALPTMSLARPAGADGADWEYELVFGMQDPDLSRSVVIHRDEVLGRYGVVRTCSGMGEEAFLSAVDADNLIEDLDRQVADIATL
jgi:hypothetical protein